MRMKETAESPPIISDFQGRQLLKLMKDYFEDPAVQAKFEEWQRRRAQATKE